MEKMPPIAKIYEAYTCIIDQRIQLQKNKALVTSSDQKKKYTVQWKDNIYSSNDSATFWQSYPGYPIIAVLMLQNKLNCPKEILPFFKKINWHKLNVKYKRNYDKAIEEVLNHISYDKNKIITITQNIYQELQNLNIQIKRKI